MKEYGVPVIFAKSNDPLTNISILAQLLYDMLIGIAWFGTRVSVRSAEGKMRVAEGEITLDVVIVTVRLSST